MALGKRFISTPSPELAYILGVLKGDGSVYMNKRGYRIELAVTSKKFASEFVRALEAIGLRAWTGGPYSKPRRKLMYKVVAFSKFLVKWYQSLTLEKLKEFLWKNSLFPSFLRGFYESEGSLNWKPRKRYDLFFYNNNLELLRLVKGWFDRKGVHTLLYETRPGNWALVIHRKRNILHFINEIKPIIKNAAWDNSEEIREERRKFALTRKRDCKGRFLPIEPSQEVIEHSLALTP